MRALVTGGSGFLGARVVLELVRRGWRAWIADPRDPGWDAPREVRKRLEALVDKGVVQWRQGRCAELLAMEVPEMDAVIHLAAHKEIDGALHQEVRLAALCGNVSMVGHVLQWAQMWKRRPLLLMASSAAVYEGGSRLRLVGESGDRWDARGCGAYGISKVLGELLAQGAGAERVTQVRYHNLMDGGEHGGGVHARMRKAARESGVVAVHGSGRQVRDFVPVETAARWTVDLVEAGMERDLPPVVEVCSGVGTEIRAVAAAIAAEARTEGRTVRIAEERKNPGVAKCVGDRRALVAALGEEVAR